VGEGDSAGHEDVRSDGEGPTGPRWVLPVAMLLVGALLGAGLTWAIAAGDDEPEQVAAEVMGTSTVPVDTGSVDTPEGEPDPTDEHDGDHGTADPDRPTVVEFGGEERAELAAQLLEVREVALRYPTYADALAAGYVPTTPYAPGLGAHLGKPEDAQPPDEPLDLQRPQSYLYDGTDPDSRVVAVMYVKIGNEEMPEGFAGPLDIWNGVDGQCLAKGTTDAAFPAKESVTEAECDSVDGTFLDTIAWTQHVWVVPGWEAPGGVFAHANPDLVCADGTTDSDPVEGCEAPSSTGGTT
jgi:hypothetical protein